MNEDLSLSGTTAPTLTLEEATTGKPLAIKASMSGMDGVVCEPAPVPIRWKIRLASISQHDALTGDNDALSTISDSCADQPVIKVVMSVTRCVSRIIPHVRFGHTRKERLPKATR